MKVGLLIIAASLAGSLLLTQSAPAAEPEAKLEANKKVALDFWREVIEAHNVEAAKKYYAPDMIQHNRHVGQGLSGFESAFKAIWKEPLPVQATLKHPPIAVIADGDLVQLVFKIMVPEAGDKTRTHEAFEFDLFRLKDGMIVEHWDSDLE